MSEEQTAKGSTPCQLVRRPDPLPKLIPQGGIGILAGSPMVGKTALLATMLRGFRDKTPIFGHQPNRIPAIGIICSDRGWDAGAGQWFGRVGFPEIKRYAFSDDAFFDPRRLRKKFDRVSLVFEKVDTLKLPPGSLIAIDTLAVALGGNLLDYDTMMQGLLEIRAMLRPRELTAFCTAHSSKLKADKRARYLRAIDQINGSTALIGFADSVLYLGAPEETGRSTYTLSWASHQAPLLTLALDRDPDTGVFQLAEGNDRTTTRRILALFPRDGSSITKGRLLEIAGRIPVSERTVTRALEALVSEELVKKLRLGQYTLAPVLPDDAYDA